MAVNINVGSRIQGTEGNVKLISESEAETHMVLLEELGYEPYRYDGTMLIYRKIEGDTDITFEINMNTREIHKFANDFRKKAEICPDVLEEILMKNAANDYATNGIRLKNEFPMEQNKRSRITEKTYIVHKTILSSDCSNQYYLKIDRNAHCLDVYEQEDNCNLRKLYPLREDFDTSGYTLFTLKTSVPCILGGGGKERMPTGIFRIVHKSGLHEEYIRSYRPGHEKVKIFGYLEVFGDYFIHSDMYLADAVSDTFRQKEPISVQDEHTCGCVRMPQEELDWLVEYVPEETMIEI